MLITTYLVISLLFLGLGPVLHHQSTIFLLLPLCFLTHLHQGVFLLRGQVVFVNLLVESLRDFITPGFVSPVGPIPPRSNAAHAVYFVSGDAE